MTRLARVDVQCFLRQHAYSPGLDDRFTLVLENETSPVGRLDDGFTFTLKREDLSRLWFDSRLLVSSLPLPLTTGARWDNGNDFWVAPAPERWRNMTAMLRKLGKQGDFFLSLSVPNTFEGLPFFTEHWVPWNGAGAYLTQ